MRLRVHPHACADRRRVVRVETGSTAAFDAGARPSRLMLVTTVSASATFPASSPGDSEQIVTLAINARAEEREAALDLGQTPP